MFEFLCDNCVYLTLKLSTPGVNLRFFEWGSGESGGYSHIPPSLLCNTYC